jgi:hypothetical protein
VTEDSKEVGATAKRRPPAAGKGRPKGTPNKVTREVKSMVLQALDKAGGVAYLERCARDPKLAPAFLTLLGKVIPLQVTGPGGGPVQTVTMTPAEFAKIAAEVAAKV